MSGPELQGRLSDLGSTLPIIFLSGYPDIPTTVLTIKAGAVDFLTNPYRRMSFFGQLNRPLHFIIRRIAKDDAGHRRTHLAALTPRERQVFDHVICGDTNEQGRPRARAVPNARSRGPSPQSDGQNEGPIAGGTCCPCRAASGVFWPVQPPMLDDVVKVVIGGAGKGIGQQHR